MEKSLLDLCLIYWAVIACGLVRSLHSFGLPCVYQGHLLTRSDWYGYLANVTVMNTGRMTFKFSYPAEKCCQNILFYLESQVSIINARMNCWQKEGLLRPENDQILRLTPRFTWSGCHLAHPNGLAMYVCEGGRSFTAVSGSGRPVTWFVAAAHCASLMGLDLKYEISVYGHIGECPNNYDILTTTTQAIPPSPAIREVSNKESMATQIQDKVCVVEGFLNVSAPWYGFISNVSLGPAGGFRFRLSYPKSMQIQNVIMYNETQARKLKAGQSCWQKEGHIPVERMPDQILDLSIRSSWNGCVSKNSSSGLTILCQGERRYDNPRKVFIAVSNCRSSTGLLLNYRFEMMGYEGETCAGYSLRQGLGSIIFLQFFISIAVIISTRLYYEEVISPTQR